MLTKEEILNTLRYEFDLDKYNVKSLGLFGSFSRDEQNEESDIDLLYIFNTVKGINSNKRGLKNDLEKKIGREIHLISERYLNERLVERVMEEIIYV